MATKRKPLKKARPRSPDRTTSAAPIALKRILVPVDFSEHSRNALRYAVPFARQFGASLDVLFVVEPAVYPADFSFGQIGFPDVEEEMRKRGAEELTSLASQMIPAAVPTRTFVRTGKPFYEIEQQAREEGADLIIIATHGHSGLEQVLFGSTAEKVVRHAPCPVLVVRNDDRESVRKD